MTAKYDAEASIASASEASKRKLVGSAEETYGAEDESFEAAVANKAGEGTLGESKVMVGVLGIKK